MINAFGREEIKKMLIETWNVICYELISSSQRRAVKREEVVRMVLDKRYSRLYGGNQKAYRLLKSISIREQIEIAKEAFPEERYTLGKNQ